MAALLKKIAKSIHNQMTLLKISEKNLYWLELGFIVLVFVLSDLLKKPSILGVCIALFGILLSLLSRLSTFNISSYDGIYKYLRHPRSLGFACVLVGILLQTNGQYLFVFTTLLFLAYIVLVLPSIDRARSNLVIFDYKDYQRNVAALLPGWPYDFLRNSSELVNNSQFSFSNEVVCKNRPSWKRRIYAAFRQEWLLLLIFLLIFLHLFQFFQLGFNLTDIQIKSALAIIYVSIFIWSHKNRVVEFLNSSHVRKKVNL